jgi:tRNA U55 pseudouridine synthase TruB
MQVPPIFSALRKSGKRNWTNSRERSASADDTEIEKHEKSRSTVWTLSTQTQYNFRTVTLAYNTAEATFRSLLRDLGYKLNTVTTIAALKRTKQRQFTLKDCIEKPDWSTDRIYPEIEKWNKLRSANAESAS